MDTNWIDINLSESNSLRSTLQLYCVSYKCEMRVGMKRLSPMVSHTECLTCDAQHRSMLWELISHMVVACRSIKIHEMILSANEIPTQSKCARVCVRITCPPCNCTCARQVHILASHTFVAFIWCVTCETMIAFPQWQSCMHAPSSHNHRHTIAPAASQETPFICAKMTQIYFWRLYNLKHISLTEQTVRYSVGGEPKTNVQRKN